MNFVNLLVDSDKKYQFTCSSTASQLCADVEKIILKVAKEADHAVVTSGDIAQAMPGSPEAISTPAPAVTKKINLAGKLVKLRKGDSEARTPVVMRFKTTEKSNYFQKLFQPNILGTISDGGNQRHVELKAQLPFLAKRLINWSINFALLAAFGMVGSYFLVPDPAPLAFLFCKATVIPLIFALILARFCQGQIDREVERVAQYLAGSTGGTTPHLVPADRSSVIRDTIISKNTLLTIALLSGVLGGAMYLHNWAWQAWTKGQYGASEALCHHVLHLAEFALGKESAGVAGCNYYIAECSRCERKNQQAEEYYLKALKIFENTLAPSHTMIADTLLNLGRVYEAQGKYALAKENYDRALKIFIASPLFGSDNMIVGHIHNRLAALEMKIKDWPQADRENQQALKIDRNYRWAAGRSIGEDLNDQGVIYAHMGKWDQSLTALNEAIKLKKDLPADTQFIYSLAVSTYNLSIAESKLGHSSRAGSLQKQALMMFRQYLQLKNDRSDAQTLYKKVLQNTVEVYEVPNVDTRTELLYPDLGRN